MPDVLTYDELPPELRVQIAYIWSEAIAEHSELWQFVHNLVAREHGVKKLANGPTPRSSCERLLNDRISVEPVLDIIEASFRMIQNYVPRMNYHARRNFGIKVTPEQAIEELNARFRRAGVGYRFENGQIIRIDSELLHKEVVRPALQYLNKPGFEGPRDEFMSAHAHHRAGETKDAITDANNAFESTIKTICDMRGWGFPPGATATQLVRVIKKNGLLPDYLERSFDQLAATLQSGLPQVRNEQGAHGQGSKPRQTPDYVASYALHLAAAKILFLAEAHLAME